MPKETLCVRSDVQIVLFGLYSKKLHLGIVTDTYIRIGASSKVYNILEQEAKKEVLICKTT